MSVIESAAADIQVRWDELVVGDKTGELTVDVTPELVNEFLKAMDVRAPVLRKGVGEPNGIAPPYLIAKLGLYPLYINHMHERGGRGVFAKQEFKYHLPVRIGDRIAAEGRLIEKYERRDKRFIVFRGEFRNGDGKLVLEERRTVMVLKAGFRIRE
jgi:hypothetical protein